MPLGRRCDVARRQSRKTPAESTATPNLRSMPTAGSPEDMVPSFVSCDPPARVPELSPAQLGAMRLPSAMYAGTIAQQLGFPFHFDDVIHALEVEGTLPSRTNGSYRPWHVYALIDGIHAHTHMRIGTSGAAHAIQADGHVAQRLPGVHGIEERWWEAVEFVRVGRCWLAREIAVEVLGEAPKARGERRAAACRKLFELIDGAVSAFPSDEAWWTDHLRSHAELVLALGAAGYTAIARDCATLFDVGAELAERRLGLLRRELRARVGTAMGAGGFPALTAAASSYRQRAYDIAADLLEATLPKFNAATIPGLRLNVSDVTAFLDFLTEVGLAQWYVDLAVLQGPRPGFSVYSRDLDRASRFGRTRSLAILLEEAMLSMALRSGAEFGQQIERAGNLNPRLSRFLVGPHGRAPLVSKADRNRLIGRTRVAVNDGSEVVAKKMTELALVPAPKLSQHAGSWEDLSSAPDAVQVLAGLEFIRNTTAHRSPSSGSVWFAPWEDRQVAIDRTLAWAGLTLWAVQRTF